MSIDKIVEAISKMEFEDLIRVGKVFNARHKQLTQAAMQRVRENFQMGDRIKIKDEKGEYHSGMFYSHAKKKVRFYMYNKELKLTPLDFERLEPEFVHRPEPQEVHKMTPEEVKKREDMVDKMLRSEGNK